MGCVSSKHMRKQFNREEANITIINDNGGADNNNKSHVVSLTSTTYGALNLEVEQPQLTMKEGGLVTSPQREEPAEVINAWELMEGLEDHEDEEVVTKTICKAEAKKSPKGGVFLKGFTTVDGKTPLKLITSIGSPRKVRKSARKDDKENLVNGVKFYTPKQVFSVRNGLSPDRAACKAVFSLRVNPGNRTTTDTPVGSRNYSCEHDSLRRKSLSPLFDPELVESYEKELSQESEQIKRMVSASPKRRKQRKSKDVDLILELFEQKCPPGGENSVVIYTTTLRGIRKTFEECNTVRSIIESYQIQTYERDVSMHSGFKEELRKIMGTKEVKVPVVFVKGRLIGGVEQVAKMDEEGKLEVLFDGIPRALAGCEGCGGIRFVMCLECNGSCKVLDEGEKKRMRCSECNENGLVQCPICC